MLFVIIIDVLNSLLLLVETSWLLQPLERSRSIPRRLSLNADDAALFLSCSLEFAYYPQRHSGFRRSHRDENQLGQEFHRANPLFESTT